MSAFQGTPPAERNDLSPGEHLRREIERLGLDQTAVGEAIGVSRQAINNVVNDRQSISRTMAAKLGRLLGRSSDYWLRQSYPLPADGDDSSELGKSRPVGVLVNHQIVRAVKDGILGIEPFISANVRLAAIELTLDEDIVTGNEKTAVIRQRKGFFLAPGRAVRARTKERIEIPRDYLGRIGAVQRLVTSGILASIATQVAPGFAGQVPFCLFNTSGEPFRLQVGDPMLSLEICALSVAPNGAP